MNSNNLDEKCVLSYVVNTLKHWGIVHLTSDILKKAKKN